MNGRPGRHPTRCRPRAEAIRAALAADGGFELTRPDRPRARPDPGGARRRHASTHLERGLGTRCRRGRADAAEVVPDTFLHPALREGMGPGATADRRRRCARLLRSSTSTTPLVRGHLRRRPLVGRRGADAPLDAVLGGEPRRLRRSAARPATTPPAPSTAATATSTTPASPPRPPVDAGAERVAVLDVDYHHGNGTQQLFYDRADVLYVSLHGDPEPGLPVLHRLRRRAAAPAPGRGTTLNLPLPPDVDDDAYLAALDTGARRRRPVRSRRRWWCPSASTPTGSTRSATSRSRPRASPRQASRIAALGRPTVVRAGGRLPPRRHRRERRTRSCAGCSRPERLSRRRRAGGRRRRAARTAAAGGP